MARRFSNCTERYIEAGGSLHAPKQVDEARVRRMRDGYPQELDYSILRPNAHVFDAGLAAQSTNIMILTYRHAALLAEVISYCITELIKHKE